MSLTRAPYHRDGRFQVLNLAREDIVWHSVGELIADVPDKEILDTNIVEFAGDDEALIDGQVEALCHPAGWPDGASGSGRRHIFVPI